MCEAKFRAFEGRPVSSKSPSSIREQDQRVDQRKEREQQHPPEDLVIYLSIKQINDSTLASTDIDSLVTRPAQQQHKYLQHHPQYQYPHHPGTNQATAPTPTTTTTTNLQKGVVKSPANGGRLPERNSDGKCLKA